MDVLDERLTQDFKSVAEGDIVVVEKSHRFIIISLNTGYTVWLSHSELEQIQHGAKAIEE